MKKILLYIYIYCFSISAFSQNDRGYIEMKGTIKIDRSGISGAKIQIIENGNTKSNHICDFNGKFTCKLELNKEYSLIVKKQNYFSKILYVNTKVPDEDVGIWSYRFSMELLPFIEGFDASLLKKPMGKIKFDDDIGSFDYDFDYTKAMKAKIAAMMRDYENKRKEAWDKMIAQADEAFNNGEYDFATVLYDKAIDLDPYDPYPDDQLYMIGKIQSKDKSATKSYEKAIISADRLLAEEDYSAAKSLYNKALKYKKEEQYPKDKIAYIENYLTNIASNNSDAIAKEKAYNEAIAAGNRLFLSKQYEVSIEKFNVATGIKPVEQYPKDKIIEITDIIAQLALDAKEKKELEKAYSEAIAIADAGFLQKTYAQARISYVKASQIKPSETYPKIKITEIDNILIASKSKQEKYNGFIVIADKNFGLKEYEAAKTNYNQALSVKPNEAYPKQKITEIDALLLALLNKNKQEKEAVYQKAITQGDASFSTKDYTASHNYYSQASTIKPNEAYPKQKITEIDALLGELASKKRAYDVVIAQADNEFNAESYENAKDNYQKALAIFPTEQYPQSRLNEIENKLLALKSANDQKVAREKAYNDAITKGDALFVEKKYQESRNSYSQALAVKAEEVYPKQKLTEIDKLIAGAKALGDRYITIIASADAHFMNKKYLDAKTTYNNALQLKPTEEYPKQKIGEIDILLAQLAANNKKLDEIKKQYDALIVQADGLYDQKNWEQAIQTYKQASVVKADEIYPKQRATEIENMLASIAAQEKEYNDAVATADNLFNAKSYGEALAFYNQALGVKPKELYPTQKITEINSILENLRKNEAAYDDYIKLADKAFSNNILQDAKGQYLAAQAIKPTEQYPKQRIVEIDALLAEQNKLKEEQDRINTQYSSLLLVADQNFSKKNYTDAKTDYQSASLLKVNESYPKEQLAKIDNILETIAAQEIAYSQKMSEGDNFLTQKNYNGALNAYQQASQIKPNEPLPKQIITQIQGLIADNSQKQKQYDGYISQADVLFNSKNYAEAKSLYQNSLTILPTESYPKSQVSNIDILIAEQLKLQADEEKINTQYKVLISSADQAFSQNSYNKAIADYEAASLLKTEESYPKGKIAEINNILETLAAKKLAYNSKMKEAEGLLNQKKYNGALLAFQQATQIKTNEQLPKQKIIEINNILAANANKQKQYDELITQADALFNNTDYSGAKASYQNALTVISTGAYPKSQITRIEQLIAEQQRLANEQKTIIQNYNKKIAEADKYFNAKNYDQSISAYMDAKGIKADETYPDRQITKVNQMILADKERVELAYSQAINKGNQFVSVKKYIEAKGQFQMALKFKPNDVIAQSKLVDLENLIAQKTADNARLTELSNKYNGFIKQADNAFKVKDYSSALAMYRSALGVKPSERYAKDKIAECEKKMREQQALAAATEEKRRQDEITTAQSSFKKGDFDYAGEKRDNKFLNELGKQYPEGITIENYDKPNKKIKRVIVNKSGIAKEYIKVKYSYGTYYFRNGQNISSSIFYTETKK